MATSLEQKSYQPNAERNDTLNRLFARAYTINWELVIYALIFVIAVFTRFAGLGDRVMSHDESLHTQFSYYLYRDGNFRHDPLMHGPILFHATALTYFLFGDNDFVARIYPAVLGVLMVMMPVLFRRWLGTKGAILASVMILISPLLLFYHRYIREDTPSIFASLIMVYCVFQYLDGVTRWRRKPIWLYIFSGAMLWSLGSKEVAFMYVAIFGSFLTMYWVFRLIQHFFKIPARTLFAFASLAVLIAGTAAMIMYAVISITFYGVPVSARFAGFPEQIGLLFSGGATPQFQAFIVWTLLTIAFFVTLLFGTMIWAYRRGDGKFRIGDILILLVLAAVLCLAFIFVEEMSFVSSENHANEVAELAIPTDGEVAVATTSSGTSVLIGTWVVCGLLIALLIYSRIAGWWRTLARFPELDILMIMGTFILPWLAPALVKVSGANPIDYSPEGITRTAIIFIPVFALSIVAGLVWNWQRWLISAAVFYLLYVFFFTTMFTNPQGLVTGIIGSLGYWLDQQGDRRGSQPQYYYSAVIMPVYEFLPLIGGFLAMCAGMVKFWVFRQRWGENLSTTDQIESVVGDDGELLVVEDEKAKRKIALYGENRLRRMPILFFVSWWAVFNFVAYTLAGEKMPWLGTHITVPFIFLSAWYFDRVFSGIDWAIFLKRGWLYLLLLPVLFTAGLQVLAPFIIGQSPFAGLSQQNLASFNQWIAVIAVAGLMIYLIVRVARYTGFMQLRRMVGVVAFVTLSVITFRAAWMAAFINYDYANEFLVYAHGAPGIKTMMSQIEDISRRTTDGMGIRFAWGGNSWPVSWYFRDLTNATYFRENPTLQQVQDAAVIYVSSDVRSRLEPLLEDRYYVFEYQRMWWPDQEYFYMTADRVINALDLSPENTQASELRHGIWDIWWARDYTRYGQAINKNYSFNSWPVSERMYFYVRKDIAAQVWNLGVGDGSITGSIVQSAEPSICATNWHQIQADFVIGDNNAFGFNHIIDIEVGADGTIYVADEFNNRVSVISAAGELVRTVGGQEQADMFMLNRPNAVALNSNNTLYIADTWNYRIQSLSADNNPIVAWGQPGQFGINAQAQPVDGFWGPRDVELDSEGNVYVSDTGNKRVRVYDASGQWLRDISSGGSGEGQIDEPSGLAIHPDGRLFVADTWNRRVSVFNSQDGTWLYNFSVLGWYQDLGSRPYLAIDVERDLIYVTDPDAARVLVYTTAGNCVGSFGQGGSVESGGLDATQFDTPSGIAVDAQGNVYVTDSSANRILRFPSFAPFAVFSQEPVEEGIQLNESIGEFTSEALPGVFDNLDDLAVVTDQVELTPELTAEQTPEPEVTETAGN